MQKTVTIRNDVNLKKNSMRLTRVSEASAKFRLEFVFDASTECTVSVHFAALELTKPDGSFSFGPLFPVSSPPKEVRGKGLGQSFLSADTHPLDTTMYSPDDLAYNPSVGRFPLIICLEAGSPSSPTCSAVSSQTTFANIVHAPSGGGDFHVVPLKQKIQVCWPTTVTTLCSGRAFGSQIVTRHLPAPISTLYLKAKKITCILRPPQVGTTSYELQEIFGIDGQGGSPAGEVEEVDPTNTRECVICMTQPRDTTVLPCRHMCMCSECAKVLRIQSNKCPICRQNIESLLQIKIADRADGATSTSAPKTELMGLQHERVARAQAHTDTE